jgi:hypothetical protein
MPVSLRRPAVRRSGVRAGTDAHTADAEAAASRGTAASALVSYAMAFPGSISIMA